MPDEENVDYMLQAMTLFREGHKAKALEVYRSRIAAFPHEDLPHWRLAQELWKMGDMVESISEYRKAIGLNPHRFGTRYTFCQILRQMRMFTEALIECDAILEDAPGHSNALLEKARCLLEVGRHDEGVAILSQIVQGDGWCRLEAALELDEFYKLRGERQKSVPHLTTVLAKNSRNYVLLMRLGSALEVAGRIQDAKAMWQKIVDIKAGRKYLSERESAALHAALDALRRTEH